MTQHWTGQHSFGRCRCADRRICE